MGATQFQAILERPEGVGTWTYLAIPFDAHTKYGSRGQVKVKGTIDGEPFRSTLLPRGDGSHYLVVPRPLRDKIGASAGAKVTVVLEMDQVAREVKVPRDLLAALRKVKGAKAAFVRLPPSHRKEYVVWIESAKKVETRQRRIAKAVQMVCEGAHLKQ